MSGVGYATLPVTLSFANAAKEINSKLKPQLDKLSKDAAAGIDKNVGTSADDAAKRIEKAHFRSKKAAEELSDAQSKLRAEQSKAKAAAIELSLAEEKLAKMKESGTASSEELQKAELELEKKRAKNETATQNVEKAERGLEKAMTESARAAEALEKAESGATDATSKFGDAAADADSKGQGFELSLGKIAAAGAVVVGAIGAAGKAAYEIGASFDDAYDTIRIGTGASGEAFEGLQESMRNVARDSIGVGSDLGEIGTTLADLNTRLGVTGEPLEKLTTQFQQLKGMGMDVDINAVTGAFQQFGVEVDAMPGMMDTLFQISQATGREMNDLVGNLSKSGPALQQFGFGLEESAGLLGALDKAGLDSEKTLGSMTKALGEFAKQGKDPQEALWGTIQQIEDLQRAGKDMEAIDLANSIFGAKGGAGFVAAVESGQFAYDDFMESIGASGDTINGLAEDTADFAEHWNQFKLQALLAIEPVATMMFDAMVPALDLARGGLERAASAVQGFAEWVRKSADWLAPLGVGLTVVAGGLAAVALQQKIVTAGSLLSWIKELSVVSKLAAGAQAALNAVMAANPIALVTVAVAGLAAGLTYFFTQTETGQRLWAQFTEFLSSSFQSTVDAITGGLSWLGEKWQGLVSLWEAGSAAMQAAGDFLRAKMDEVIGSIIARFEEWRSRTNAVIEGIKGFFRSFAETVRNSSKQAIDAVGQIPTQVKNMFSNAGSWLVNAGKNMIQGFINGVLSMGSKVANAVKNVIPFNIGGLIPGFADGGQLPGFARGGVLPDVPGIPRSVRDPILGVSRTQKMPIARVEPGEFIVNREATARHLPLLRAINGGQLHGAAGGDGLPRYANGGLIQSMINVVKQKYPMLQVTSTVRPGEANNHGAGRAVDFSNGSGNTPQQLALARDLARVYPESLELIYDSPGWAGNIKNGKNVGAFGQFYTMAQAGPHHHHVHWAMATPPTKPLDGPAGSGNAGGSAATAPPDLPAMKWSEQGLTVNAVRAGRAIALQFPEVKTIGGYRPVDPYPDHPSGRALDVMTYTDQALGDRILNYLFDNNGFFKMQYAIWKQAMWYTKGAPQPMADRGSPTQNHMDHVHAYFEASPRATGNEKYPNTIGAGGAGVPSMQMGDANLPLDFATGASGEAKDLKGITSKTIDYGTAAQLASKYDSDKHRDAALREYLKRARVYDTGGILPTGGVAVNLGKPELVFPAQATTAMLQMARQTPQYVAAMEQLSAAAPELADAVDKMTDLDYGVIAEEVAAAWRNEDFGYGELARAIGDEAAERIVTEIAFIGDQIRDMQDGSNIRAYLADLRPSEAVGLADQAGQIVGVKGINSTFGGVAKAYESLQDAAVMQVDAADAVAQAEENLTDVRRQYAEMLAEAGGDPEASIKTQRKIEDAERKLAEARKTGDPKKIADAERGLARTREDAQAELEKSGVKNADQLVKASEAVTAAEQEREKALGVVQMAARATGQAQIAMALEVAEMVVKIGKQLRELANKITTWISGIRTQTRAAVWELTKSWSELTGVVDQHRSMVAELQMQLVTAAIEVVSKSMDARTAQVDVVRAQLEGAKNVAEAEAALQGERDKVMGKQKWNFRDMSLEYDRFRQGYRDGINEQIAGMTQLSVQERDRIMATIGGVGRLSSEERARLVDAVAGMSDLSAEERARIVNAINGNGELTAADRARLSAAIAGMAELSSEERARMQSALTGIGSVSARERDRITAAMDGLVSLTAEERARLSASVAGMSELSERERARVMVSLNGVGQLADEERDRVRQAVWSFDDLTAGERERINAALAGVGELTVEERARVTNAIANMGDLSAEERERIIRAINGVSEVAQEERLRVVAALTGIGSIHGKEQDLTNQIVANADKEGLAVKLGLDAKLAAQRAADDAYVASVNGREVGERELHQMYKLQLAEQLVGEQAFQNLKAASLDAQLEWQRRVDKAAQLGLEAELKARAVVTPEILALQREVYAAEFAQQKSVLDAQIKNIEATHAQQRALVTMGRLQEDLERQHAELAQLSGQTMGMSQGQAIVMEEIARLQKENAEILGKRNSAGAKARRGLGRLVDWNGDGDTFGRTNSWSAERKQYDAQIAANNRQIEELQKSVYAKGAFTAAEQRQIDDATKLAARYYAQGLDDAAKAALAASPLGNAQRALEVSGTNKRITDWEKQQRDLQRSQQDALAEFKMNTQVLPLQWRSQELGSRESAQRYAADALRSENDGVRDALATLSRLEESNAAELKQLREKPTVVNLTVPGPRDGVTTIGEMEDALVTLASELGATRTDVKRLNEAQRTSASDRVRAAIGRY